MVKVRHAAQAWVWFGLCILRETLSLSGLQDKPVAAGRQGGNINPLAALLAPLAGLALMGAAAAVSVNPMLLQLTTITRGRRAAGTGRTARQMRALEQFLAIPSRAGLADRMTAEWLDCTGLASRHSGCLQLLSCSYSAAQLPEPDREVAAM